MFDVVVYGATGAGVMAAVVAARAGCRVALAERGSHVGGMVSGGLGWTDYGDHRVIGGLAREFYAAVADHYGEALWAVPGPEPRVAEAILWRLLRAAGVEVVLGADVARLDRDGRSIRRLHTGAGDAISGRAFIDASYEGDLLPLAGVSYRVGRESVSLHGESWAGRQPIRPDAHQFAVPVPATDADGSLLPLVNDRPMVPEGEGDGAVQSFCYRLCLTDDPANRVPFPRPDGYDPRRFELVRRYLAALPVPPPADRLVNLRLRIPGGKVDANSVGPLSTDLLDGSAWEYPDADPARREAIRRHHLSYTQGLLYFLANDPAVPDPIRAEFGRWGLCADEFADTGHWPHQLYVREGRRITGEYVVTQHDLDASRAQYDAVAMASYHIDIREVQRVPVLVPRHGELRAEAQNEGYLSVPVAPWQVPYRALLPRYDEADNLLVPVCVSASHVAFASLRMEPQYMMLGHAAGVAAALAVRDDCAVQRVQPGELRERLMAAGQVLSLPGRADGERAGTTGVTAMGTT